MFQLPYVYTREKKYLHIIFHPSAFIQLSRIYYSYKCPDIYIYFFREFRLFVFQYSDFIHKNTRKHIFHV